MLKILLTASLACTITGLVAAPAVADDRPVLTYLPYDGDFSEYREIKRTCHRRKMKVRVHMNKVWQDDKLRSQAKDVQYRRSTVTQKSMRQFAMTDCMKKNGYATIFISKQQSVALRRASADEKSTMALAILETATASTWEVDLAGRAYDSSDPVPLKDEEATALVSASREQRIDIYYGAIVRMYHLKTNSSAATGGMMSKAQARRLARKFADNYQQPAPAAESPVEAG
jgi:hypothetical protein